MLKINSEEFGLSVRKKKGVHHPTTKGYLIDKTRKEAKKQMKIWRDRQKRQIYMKRHYDQIPDDNRVLDNHHVNDNEGGCFE